MVPPAQGGLEAPPRTGDRDSRPRPHRQDDGWRLLVRIAQVRWVAVALGTAFAVVGPHPGVAAWPLLLLAVVAAAYNLVVTCHRRLPQLESGAMMRVTLAGDFVWITAAAILLTGTQDGASTALGYVVLGAESGLLLGWRGAAVALVAGIGTVIGLRAAGVQGQSVPTVSEVVFEAGAVAVSGTFAAVGAAELREQQSELRTKNAALARHARTDHLTGLGNRCAMNEALGGVAPRAYGLLLIDVDNLRWANTVYGHQAGDEMLVSVGRVIASLRRPDDLASRMGEDKFILVLPGADRELTTALGEEVRAAMHSVAVSTAQLRVSVGCAWSSGGEDPMVVVARADDALYAAKAHGGDRVTLQGGAGGKGRWQLREAVESILDSNRGVYSVYQSIVRLHDRSIMGWEALSRPHEWPVDADVESMFLTAHRMGRGRDLDWRCRRNALWEAARLGGVLFVNVNVGGLVDPVHGVDQMLLVCQWASRTPDSVVLELSERDAMPDLPRLRTVLADYRAAGFRFALDDLGEGQTTLEELLAAKPEFLKLARPLVQASRIDPAARSAVRALVAFAHDTGAAVIAEGVEVEADAEHCAALRIDLAQGWLFGRPLPADRIPS